MSHIDCRAKTIDVARAAAARARGSGFVILVDAEVATVLGDYIDTVPVITDPEQPYTVLLPAVDLDELKTTKIKQNSDALWAHVETRIDEREQKALMAVRIQTLAQADPNPEAVAVLDGMMTWIASSMVMATLLRQAVLLASTPEEVDAIIPDFTALTPPTILTAGELTFMLYAGAP